MIELIIIGGPLVLAVPLWRSFSFHKKSYRKRNPGCWWIPPTRGAMLANVLTTFSFMAFLWIFADFKPYL